MKNSLSKNYVYNLIYQVLVVIIPIILIPYLSRVLEPTGVGIYSFSYSVTSYFSYLALLGVHLYGTKTISVARKDSHSLKKAFWEIFSLKVVTSVIAAILFYALYQLFPHPEIFAIQGIFILSNFIDISWFYTGSERFKSIVIRNSFIKVLTLILIFLLVKNPNDLWIYTLILAASETIGQLLLWIGIPKEPLVYQLSEIKSGFNPFSHLKGMLFLFLPQAIIMLYTGLSATMIGILSSDEQVGFFDVSAKIVNTILIIATALGTVMIPRVSQLYDEGNHEKIKEILKKSVAVTTYLGYPMMIGLFVLAPIFVPWFFGDLFVSATLVLAFYALKIGFVVVSNVVGMQYMIPTNKNRQFIISVSLGAIITLMMNIVFIPYYGALGAVIVSLIAEALVTIYQVFSMKDDVPFVKYILTTWKSLLSSLFIGLTIYLLSQLLYPVILEHLEGNFDSSISVAIGLGILAFIGISIYGVINLLLRNQIQKEILQKMFSVFKKKRT